jgi:hypothetical protein
MNKVLKKLKDPKFLKHFHRTMTIIWILLVLPTILFWAESVLWVALMSIWANVAAHWGAYQATRAEEENGK